MISRHCFSKEWITKVREKYPKADPYLIERQITAFELLSLLIQSGKYFLFKGGTSLILLLPVARRLSIDIDVVGDFSNEELSIQVKKSLFIRMQEDEREKKGIPKRHFKFFYNSVVDGREAYVLLDVLYADHGFPNVISIPVVSNLFEIEQEIDVITPTIDGITGDKLTAFAPNTIGIPYRTDKSMEIIKQLFDIGELFNHCTDLSEISTAYNNICKQESSFRKVKFTLDQILDDTVETAFLLSQAGFKGSVDNDEFKEMHKGIKQLTNYFLGIQYSLEHARVSASKAALLALLLKAGNTVRLEELRFSESMLDKIKDVSIEGKYRILNKLKKVNPTAFYYWWLASKQ